MKYSCLLKSIEKNSTIKYGFYIAAYILVFYLYLPSSAHAQSLPFVKEWDKTLGGSNLDGLNSIINTRDGGFLIGGYSNSGIGGDKSEGNKGLEDYWIIKVDKNGNKLWDKTFGGIRSDAFPDMVTASDGGYLLAGYSLSGISGDRSEESRGSLDYWIIKMDENGNKLWDKAFGGGSYDQFQAVITTPDGGYLLGGYSYSGIEGDKSEENKGLADYWIIKIDKDGKKVWDKSYGGNDFDQLLSLVITSDGGYLLGGSSYSGIGGDKSEAKRDSSDFWVVKIDSIGNKQWDKTFGGNSYDQFTSLVSTKDGYLLGGHSKSGKEGDKSEEKRGETDYWVVMIDKDGNKIWDKTFGGIAGDVLYSIVTTPDGGYLLGGESYSETGMDKSDINKGGSDYWTIKIDKDGKKVWDKSYGGTGLENLRAITATAEGGYLLGGTSYSGVGFDKSEENRGNWDYWIIKIGKSVTKQDQTISFDTIFTRTFGDPPFRLNATASSALPVTFYVVSGPVELKEDSVIINGAGLVTIEAIQEGNATYNPAPPVRRTIEVQKATPVINWNPLSILEQTPLGEEQLNAVATFKGIPVPGSFVYAPIAGTTFPAGTYNLSAGFIPADTANYNPVPAITRTITVTTRRDPVVIKSFSPSSGPAGTFVVINGNNMYETAGVCFHEVSARHIIISNNLLIAIVPIGATTGFITIRAKDGSTAVSNSVFVVTYPKPSIFFFTPGVGKAGTMVTILGANFGGTKEVRFNGITAQYYKVLNAYTLQALVPDGATTGKISVVTPGGIVYSSYNFYLLEDRLTMQKRAEVKEQAEEGNPVIYPNPFTTYLTINIKNSEGIMPVEIFDMQGRLVQKVSKVMPGQKIEVRGDLAPGMYFLKAGTGKEAKCYKVLHRRH